ncbi:hypothetical protein GCM10018783_31050 [Streptomyces griseosporeus]|nr:hypothetical protein GCM10018783_31050 [Streptomyces griseosporeus]
MLQASAWPAAPSASAAEAVATPRMRAERAAVRRVMDTFVLYVLQLRGVTEELATDEARQQLPHETHRSISVP